MDIVTFTARFIALGAVAANALVLFSLLMVLLGGPGSTISKNRRLPQDSDVKLLAILMAVGGLIGLGFAYLGNFQVRFFEIPTALGSFCIGNLIAFMRVRKLNEQYLKRAEQNVLDGDYRGAIEDAKEVARSSEVLRKLANTVLRTAQEMQRDQAVSGLDADSPSDSIGDFVAAGSHDRATY